MSDLLTDEKNIDIPRTTPPISRNGFSFQAGVFYIQDDPHRHPRMSANMLYELLAYTPPPPRSAEDIQTPKGKSKYTTSYKDRPAHFYSAQLAHYGLKVLKTRDPAKKMLRSSFHTGVGVNTDGKTLQVPKDILDLEAALSKEWTETDDARRVRFQAAQEVQVELRKKAARDRRDAWQEAYWTHMEQEEAEEGEAVVHPEAEERKELTSKPRTKQTARRGGAPRSISWRSYAPDNSEPKLGARAKQTASRGGGPFTLSKRSYDAEPVPDEEPLNKKPRTKQTARRGGGHLKLLEQPDSREDSKPITLKEEPGQKKDKGKGLGCLSKRSYYYCPEGGSDFDLEDHTIRQHINSLSEEYARKILIAVLDKVPAAREVLDDELSGIPKPKSPRYAHKGNGVPLRLDEWTGEYLVASAQLAENWDQADGDLNFEAYPSSNSAHLWASFDFGIISGVMRSIGPPPTVVGEKVFVQWRGREEGEGVMTFGIGNRGILRFFGSGNIEADMRGAYVGKFYFSGIFDRDVPRKTAAQAKLEVEDWKEEWRGINRTNYEVESKAKWGKWGGKEKDEAAFESDTTYGHHKREEPDFGEFSEWE